MLLCSRQPGGSKTLDDLVDTLRKMHEDGKRSRVASAALTLFGMRYTLAIDKLGGRSVKANLDALLQAANITPNHEGRIWLGMSRSRICRIPAGHL